VFNEVFYDYEEEWGRVDLDKFKNIMKFVKIEERIPDFKNPEDDPFSEVNAIKAFKKEELIKYVDQE
jgi:hypothetical protein